MKAGDVEPDRFYLRSGAEGDRSASAASSRCSFSSTPCSTTFRGGTTLPAGLDAGLADLGNHPEVDEYIRRQTLSAKDYAGLQGAPAHGLPERAVPDGALRRSPAGAVADDRSSPTSARRDRRSGCCTTIRAISPPTTPSTASTSAQGPVVGARPAGGALPAAGGAGGGGPAARSRRSPSRRRSWPRCNGLFFTCAQWGRGAPLQPAADRRRVDQGNGVPVSTAPHPAVGPAGGSMANGVTGSEAQTRATRRGRVSPM